MSRGEIIAESAVRLVRDFDAPPAKVWAFLTETSLLPEWYGDGVIETREGGRISLMAGHIRGVVTGWWPEKFLAYTWNVFQPGETPASSSEAGSQTKASRWKVSYVEFTLKVSRITLIHRPIPQAMQNQTMMGWHTMLDMIARGLKGEFPPRAEVMHRNAALYGIDLNALNEVK